MLANKLKLHNSKTEVLVIGARHRPHPQLDLLLVGDVHVVPTSSVRNLGTIFDDKMTIESHIAAICGNLLFFILGILLQLSDICRKRILRLQFMRLLLVSWTTVTRYLLASPAT